MCRKPSQSSWIRRDSSDDLLAPQEASTAAQNTLSRAVPGVCPQLPLLPLRTLFPALGQR